ncbi:proline-rich receptor-like protein kinase PERK9 [Iris pallida]|uniref:Proline-rich receptor-like protein kinase PERK9 n=1 Tax=Iris pallida TaxID=29817 RepID=A0AAX6HZL0_IRIPA|nr:proline-rich receptor-like protein kinase PERK9 [Iris pallida]KAJ6846459.1 proline-rich receptor-like protein kinase PERK9 [Iris pallida]
MKGKRSTRFCRWRHRVAGKSGLVCVGRRERCRVGMGGRCFVEVAQMATVFGKYSVAELDSMREKLVVRG